jgi:hypothetical protein
VTGPDGMTYCCVCGSYYYKLGNKRECSGPYYNGDDNSLKGKCNPNHRDF